MPGALTTTAGGGADTVAAAIFIGVGVFATATTETPEELDEEATAAIGSTAVSRVGEGAEAPTAHNGN